MLFLFFSQNFLFEKSATNFMIFLFVALLMLSVELNHSYQNTQIPSPKFQVPGKNETQLKPALPHPGIWSLEYETWNLLSV
jgi:hypothetical protein